MGRGRKRAAVATGALVLAMAMPSGPVAADAWSGDCDRAGGGLAESLCELVGVVGGLTGVPLAPPVEHTGEPAVDDHGSPTDPVLPLPSVEPGPAEMLPETFDSACLPLIPTPGCLAEPAPPPDELAPEPEPSPTWDTQREHADRRPERRDDRLQEQAARPPGEPPVPPDHRPLLRAEPRPVPAHRVDPEAPRIELLWPYPDRLPTQMRGQKAIVKPGRPSDALGTVLTAALLLSAILAARIAYARRAGDEHGESIPFEPLRARGRQHLVRS